MTKALTTKAARAKGVASLGIEGALLRPCLLIVFTVGA